VNISHISTNYKEGYVEYIDKFINWTLLQMNVQEKINFSTRFSSSL
jgi:hypothetical protein